MPPKSPSVLPISVVQRLEEQRLRLERGAFTSSFGVGEWLLSRAAGYESLGQVMGAGVFQIGKQWTNSLWRGNTLTQNQTDSMNPSWRNRQLSPAQLQLQKSGREMEITTHTAAYATARRTALQRLEAEATLLGATGVAGVRLSMKVSRAVSGSGAPSVEFLAVGTAVSSGIQPKKPWLSNLSGQELWQLGSVGYAPCGFVGGNCSFLQTMSLNSAALMEGNFLFADQQTHNFAARNTKVRALGGRFLNFELPEFSHAVYRARELALTRLEDEARACGADGIVGLQIELDENAHIAVPGTGEMRAITFSFLALGTAIRREKAESKGEISAILNLK